MIPADAAGPRASSPPALDRTLFVEAGAGSGKTQSLVDRVVAHGPGSDGARTAAADRGHHLHREGRRRAARPAAHRLRAVRRSDASTTRSDRRSGRRRRSTSSTRAAIGTLHSFAQRILTEHPIEAGLPPLIEVLDEVASAVAFDERCANLRAAILDDPALTPSLLLALSAGMRLDDLRSLARDLHRQLGPHRRPGARRRRRRHCPLWTWPDSSSGPATWRPAAEHCQDATDRLLPNARGGRGPGPTRLAAARRRPEPGRRAGRACRRTAGTSGRRGTGAARSTTSAPPAGRCTAEATGLRPRVARRRAPPAGPAGRRGPRWPPRRCAARRGGWSSTTCWCSPATCCATPRTAPPCAPRCTGATSGCCSTSSRTPTRSRSSSPCGSPAAPTADAARVDGRRRRRRAASSSSATRSSRSTGSAGPTSRMYLRRPASASASRSMLDDQLPHRRARSSTGSTHVFGALIAAEPTARSRRTQPLRAVRAPTRPAGPAGGRARRRARTTARSSAARAARARGRRRRRRRSRPALAERLAGRDDGATDGWRPRTARRHRDPGPGPHLAAAPRGRARRGRHPVPRRVELAGLPHRRGPRPARRPPARSPTPPTSCRCVTALRSPLFGCGDDDLFGTWRARPAAGGTSPRRPPDAGAADHPVGAALALPARGCTTTRALADARASCSARLVARPPGARGRASPRPRTRDVWRRLRFVIDQARAWSRGRARRAARATWPGSTRQGSDDRPGRRGGAARDRRRRRADHDHPRRQGPRVPDGHPLRHDDPARQRARAASRCSGRRAAGTRCKLRKVVADRRLRRRRSRSTSRWTTHERHPPALRRLHPGPRPPRRLAAPQGAAVLEPDRGPPRPSCSPRACAGAPRDGTADPHRRRGGAEPPRLVDAADPSVHSGATRSGRCGPAAARPSAVSASGLEGTEPSVVAAAADVLGEPADPGLAKDATRPRAAAVDQGPLRHRDRPGRARRAADGRPRHRRRAGRRGGRPVLAEGVTEHADLVAGAGPVGAGRRGRPAGRRPPALARDLRRHAGRRPGPRGLRRPALPRRRRRW